MNPLEEIFERVYHNTPLPLQSNLKRVLVCYEDALEDALDNVWGSSDSDIQEGYLRILQNPIWQEDPQAFERRLEEIIVFTLAITYCRQVMLKALRQAKIALVDVHEELFGTSWRTIVQLIDEENMFTDFLAEYARETDLLQ